MLDAMGGDYAPAEIVKGAVDAAKDETLTVILVGDQAKVGLELKKYPKKSNIETVHASEDIAMSEHPVEAVRQKKDASINVCMRLLKEGKVDAVVSAGNTGAVMAAALFGLGRIKGIERPAIASLFPAVKGHTALLDIGANADCRPNHLVQFAYMGKAYIEKVIGVENPRIGLLNIGEEDEKGSELTVASNKLLRLERANGLNFIGNIEGKDILENNADVVVCDGFVGNVVLKFAEGLIFSLSRLIKQGLSPLAWLGLLLMLGSLFKIKSKVDYKKYGGAPLLGVNGVVIITHGRAKSETIKNSITAAAKAVRQNLIDAIRQIKPLENPVG
ncbi:phosphate acyltransferase [Candidatus Termititenax persephonae]|uniref:Phosphate acyltransferase n=1 Tax=Candidatus Termititenax persephonae TaxID=2218525 RepID=A0A388TF01_9BACT|nr:phosphate acyltransferase [Candidatus Termititenax persephonae]